MPYKIVSSGRGFKVATVASGRTHSFAPLPLVRAKKQLIALNIRAKK